MATLNLLEKLSNELRRKNIENEIIVERTDFYIKIIDGYITVFPSNKEWFDSKFTIYLSDDISPVTKKIVNNFSEATRTINKYREVVNKNIQYTVDDESNMQLNLTDYQVVLLNK